MIDCFYTLIEESILTEYNYMIDKKKYILLNNKKIVYLAIPHPSSANPLSGLITKIYPLITNYIERATKANIK